MRAVSPFLTLILASHVVSSSLGTSYSTTDSSSTTSTTQATSSACKSGLARSYEQAIVTYPHLKDAIEKVAQQTIGQWFADRQSNVASVAKQIFLERCSDSETSDSDDSRPPVVAVYGLPQRDCSAGFSSDGSNKNTADYRGFLQLLVDQAQNQRVIYILEPDAIGLLAEDGCGNAAGYAENLAIALEMLSANANADIYIDIGYWTLSDDEKAGKVAKIVEKVGTAGKCKGIALNTANYRSIDEMTTLCERFSRVSGKNYHCIIDTLEQCGYTTTITQTTTATTTDDVPSIQPASSDSPSPSSSSTEEPNATPTPGDASGSGGSTASATPVPTVVAEAGHVEYTIDMADDEYTLQYASSGAGDTFEPVIEDEDTSTDTFEPVIEEETQDDAGTAGSVEAQATEDEGQGDVAQDTDAVNGSAATGQYPEEAQVVPSETQQQSYREPESEETESSPAPTTESDAPSVSPTYC